MKRILIVSGTSFIGKAFIGNVAMAKKYVIDFTTRQKGNGYYLDFYNTSSIVDFELNENIDGIVFTQGINPHKNLKETSFDHFEKMYRLNISGPSLLLKKIVPKLNKNASVVFLNSIASTKGSYDPAYAASKSALDGLIASLSKAYDSIRFNSLMLGLVENSTVFNSMTEDFRKKHTQRMYGGNLIKVDNVISMIDELLDNININNSKIPLHGGYTI